MPSAITHDEERLLAAMETSLLADRQTLGPGQGDEAFRQHKLLAMAVHRASRLNRRASDQSETEAWVRYFGEYFPTGRNDRNDAKVLWEDWRTRLVKDNAPGLRVAITHGQAAAHWNRDHGPLILNLEDLWVDFEQSVKNFGRFLRSAPDRRRVAIQRWEETNVTVQTVWLSTVGVPVSGASVMAILPQRQ